MIFLISDEINTCQKTPDYQCVNRQSFKNRHINIMHIEKHYPKHCQAHNSQNQSNFLIGFKFTHGS